MRLPPVLLSILLLAPAACGEFPELEEIVDESSRNARYPKLVPIETLKRRAGETQIDTEAMAQTKTRVESLRERATKLQESPVVDPATQERMKAGVE